IDKETKLGILASYHAGMVLVDFTNPQMPQYLGCYDTVGSGAIVTSVTGCDSFAYISWPRPRLISIDISDPRHPVRAGGCENMFNPPEDMVLRDSFVYCAEANRFQVVNVARPRDPRLVGSCVVEEDAEGLCLVDSIAYVANYPFAIINVRQPSNPFIISRIWRGAWNGTVRDSFLFLSSGGVLVYSVADLRQPHLIDSLSVGPNTYWVEAVGSLLYTGNRDGVRVIDASDVHDMRVLGFCSAPYVVKRLAYVSPYLYAVCWDAGVCIFESTPIGVSELQSPQTAKGKLMVIPNPTRGRVRLAPRSNNWGLSQVIVRDALGREVAQIKCQRDSGECLKLNLNDLKRGLYFVEFVSEKQRAAVIVKIIKQ
ncbi:MAG: T9SS type A sorting domain-containing protein, partial [candidate division WOR-3 bacterium]